MAPHDRGEIEAALARQRAHQDAQDWDGYCGIFTDDAVYVEHERGTFEGRDAIRAWLVPEMAPLVDAGWDYPIDWTAIDGDRVVYRWRNRMPHPDGSRHFEFVGFTALDYAGDGRFSRQEDVYNMKECEAALREWFAAGGKL